MKTKAFTFPRFYFLLFCLITACTEQEKPIKEHQLVPETELISNAEAQIAEYVRNTVQDKNGGLWFGTNNLGVAHYNGDSLLYYSNEQGFGGGQITGMVEDLDENLWFATNQGVVKYDWSTTKEGDKLFTNYAAKDFFEKAKPWSIYADSKGIIWVGTSDKVYRFDGTQWEPFELPYAKDDETVGLLTDVVTWSILEDRKGNFWFGTNGNGAIKFNGKAFRQFTVKDGLTDNSVDGILEDRKGNLWFGTRFGGLSFYNGQGFINYTSHDVISNDEVCIMYEDKAGNIWFSAEGFGVYRYDGVFFTNFGSEQGLGVAAVQTIFEDREGQFWVGGGGGLYRFDGQSFFNVTKSGPWN